MVSWKLGVLVAVRKGNRRWPPTSGCWCNTGKSGFGWFAVVSVKTQGHSGSCRRRLLPSMHIMLILEPTQGRCIWCRFSANLRLFLGWVLPVQARARINLKFKLSREHPLGIKPLLSLEPDMDFLSISLSPSQTLWTVVGVALVSRLWTFLSRSESYSSIWWPLSTACASHLQTNRDMSAFLALRFALGYPRIPDVSLSSSCW